jgi:hypothetical protein
MRTIKITTVLLAIPLGIYLAAAPFVRYAWDDFCTAAIVHHSGFWTAQRYWYAQWSGRFSFTAIVSLADLMGPAMAQAMPIAIIGAFFVVLAWALSRVWTWLGASNARWPAALIALAVIYASLLSNPQIGEVLYWQTGLLTYPLGLTFFAAVAGLSLGRAPRLAIIFLLAAVGSGFTEAVSAGQIAFFAVALAATFIFPSNSSASAGSKSGRPDLKRTVSLRWPLTAALAGSMVGTAIVAASPGNAIRLAALHNPPFDPVYFVRRVPILVAASLLISARSPMLLAILMGGGIASAGTLPQLASRSLIKEGRIKDARIKDTRSGVPINARSSSQINSPRTWIVFFAGSLIVLAACVAPSAYGRIFMGRTQMVPQFFLSLATVTFGVLLGLAWPATRRATAILLVAVAAVSSAWQTTRAVRQLPAARDYAHQFDQRQLDLRQPEQGEYAQRTRSPVVMDRLRSTTLILSDGAGPDANDWTNRCEADYYDLPSVRTTK